MEKSLVLIDGENVIKGWQKYCNEKQLMAYIDYVKLVDKLSEGTNRLRAIFYDGVPESIPLNKKKFHNVLQHNGIQLRTKLLKVRPHFCTKCRNRDLRTIQKGVDVSLATDILRHAWQKTCDICIVVSGDEDYRDAIDCAKERGLKIWVASFKNCLSRDLRKSADKMIFIEDIFEQIKLEKKLPQSLNSGSPQQ